MHACPSVRVPKSNTEYWQPKLIRNRERDAQHVDSLVNLGWRVLTVWECETADLTALEQRIRRFLEST
jgi:DNA mismatch endonuclease, patch repair protein